MRSGEKKYLVSLENIWRAELRYFIKFGAAQVFSTVLFLHYIFFFIFLLRLNIYDLEFADLKCTIL